MTHSVHPALEIVHGLDDPLRYAVLSRLVSGPATVSELMAQTGAAQSKLSNHLAILFARGMVTRERLGRHTAYALAGPDIAHLLETLDSVAGTDPETLGDVPHIVLARRCYDHLAGRLGVAVFAALVAQQAIEPVPVGQHARKVRSGLGDVTLAAQAPVVFGGLGIDLDAVGTQRRRFATACNDWTESQPHLAGALGAALQAAFFRDGWLQRRSGTRALRVTPSGRRELPRRFGAPVAALLT